jgi:hypothetical protein
MVNGTLLQLNFHETDLLFGYLSHHLTWHCSSISENLHKLLETITKTILRSYAANFLQI